MKKLTVKLMAVILTKLLGACMSTTSIAIGGGDSWKEEALQPDGRKLVVERNVTRKGRHEIGQRPPIGTQSLTFTMVGSAEQVKWEDNYSEELGGASFNPMFLGVIKGTAFVVATPAGCLSYNKWGRPNPPYVIFKYQANAWQRIALQELPGEIVKPNLIISSPDDEVEKSGKRFITADLVERMNHGFSQPQYKTILREPLPKERINQKCGDLVLYKGAWIMPNDPVARRMIDLNSK